MTAGARPKVLTEQVVVRLPLAMREAIERDAAATGRTTAQTVRFAVQQYLTAGQVAS